MKVSAIPAVLLLPLAAFACQGSSGPNQNNPIRFEPPNTSFAAALNITPPVTSDQAMAIAEEATGGTATGVTEEMEGGELLYEVKVNAPAGRLEVEIRASDGGVVEIEPDDGT